MYKYVQLCHGNSSSFQKRGSLVGGLFIPLKYYYSITHGLYLFYFIKGIKEDLKAPR